LQLEVERSTLVVSDTNATVPAQRQPLDPNKPNSTTVTVSVFEQGTNAPVPNTTVTLSSTDNNTLWVVGNTARVGQIVAQTDSNGKVQATFYTSTRAGEVTITATIDLGGGNTLTKQATITQEPGPPVLTATVDKSEIFVRLPDNFNGFDYSDLPRKAQVTAKVADANGNPHKDIVVNFTASDGIITSAATTDGNGEAKVDYSPPDLVPTNGQVTITAQITVNGSPITGQTTLRVRPGPPAQISIAANPSELPPDGRSTSVITATVKDANGNDVKDGTKVTFELQQPIPQGTTWLPNRQDRVEVSTVNGQAQATLLAGTQAGKANIKVSAEETIGNRNYKPEATIVLPIGVILQPIQVTQANLFVSKRDYSSFGAKYLNETGVTVEVKDASGKPVEDVKVVLTASDAGSRWKVNNEFKDTNTVELTTGSDGKATATYVASTKAGQVTIEARMGEQVQTATINQQAGPPQVTITANPEKVFVRLAGAQYQVLPQQSQITVKVADENGNPHENATVQLTLETQTGPTGALTAVSGRTDNQGQFVTTYQSPPQVPSPQSDMTGVVTVKVSATTIRNENATSNLDLTILPGPPALVSLTADKYFVPANKEAILTAQVVDENGNKVRDGIVVAFRQILGPTDVTITPVNDGRVDDGQASATLTAGNTSGAVVVEAKAEQVEDGNRYEAVAQITVNVATTKPPVIVESLQVSPARIVVSNSNAVDPVQRQPLDPARPNRTTATVVVVDENNKRPVAGILVVFKVEGSDNALLVSGSNRAMGQPLTVTTDQNGQAQVEIYAPMEAGQVTVKASVDSNFPAEKTKSALLTFEPGLPLLQLALGHEEVYVKLPDSEVKPQDTDVTVSVKDANGNGFANQRVQLQVDVGVLQGQVTGTSLTVETGSNGEAKVKYIPPMTVPSGGRATITAQANVNGNNLSASVVVRVRPGPPYEVQVTANPVSLPNDGRSESVITAEVKDANGNPVRDGTVVTFAFKPEGGKPEGGSRPEGSAVWLPTLQNSISVGTVNGQAQARLRAGTRAELAIITVTAEGKEKEPTEILLPIGVVLQPIQVSRTDLFVSKQGYFSFNGDKYPNEATVTVEVKDASGNPIDGVKVVLTASDAGSRWKVNNEFKDTNTVELTTGSDGKATATYVASTKAGQVTITAMIKETVNQQEQIVQSQTVTINQLPGPPAVAKVEANPKNIYVSLQGDQYASLPQQSQITIYVADENGNPHPNASVQLRATAGTFAQPSGQTDSQGRFVTTFTAPAKVPPNNEVVVTANITTQWGDTVEGETTLTVQPGPPAVLELTSSKLTLSASDSADITVTVKDANGNPVPRQTVTVTFNLQVSQANQNKVTLSPNQGNPNNNGQVMTTLRTDNAAADNVRVIATAEETIRGITFSASNQLIALVGVTATLSLQIATRTLVVSNSNVADPAQRQPLDPARQNRTLVTVEVSLDSEAQTDVIIPVELSSSDDNTLWQDVANPSLFALKQLILSVTIPSGQTKGTAQAFFYASTKRALNLPNEPSVAITAALASDPNIKVTKSGDEGIIQLPGPPATIALDFLGFDRSADNVPYLTVNPANRPTGNITATVRDANGNPINGATVNFALLPANLGADAGTFTDTNEQTSQGTTDDNGQVAKTLRASNFTTEVTLQVQSGNASITQPIRYSVSIPGLTITANPNQIPDDGTTTSTITIVSSASNRPLPEGLKFRLAADLGATLTSGGETGSSIIVTVDANNKAGATLKGPAPDLAQTQPRTITLTASLIVDGQPRTFTQTVTLNKTAPSVEEINTRRLGGEAPLI
jgi:nitrogen fixation protein FixH